MTLILPEEHGGIGDQRCTALCVCVEELAQVCASSALMMIIQAVGSFPVVHAGSDEILAEYLPRLSEGRQLAAYLVTEPGAGSDVSGVRTTAVRDGDEYVLNGTKCFATNGGVAGVYSVLARTAEARTGGLTFLVVDRDAPGVSIGRKEDKLGQRGSNTTEVMLDDVRVPASHVLGGEGQGFKVAMADFDMSRPAIAAQGLGIAQGANEYALEYARTRVTFGKPIAEHQLIMAMLADGATAIEAGRGLVYRAAAQCDAGVRNTKLASMAKCFCGDTAMKVTTDAIQVLGGYGYMKDHPLERMFRDAKLTQIFEGTNQIQRLVVARELMAEGER
jgi:cyclohexane-1-carbonyl-CoA dehydrogenase